VEIVRALTLEDLTMVTEVEVLMVPQFGAGCLAEVQATLAHYGMALAG
jgi:hypothetical protein